VKVAWSIKATDVFEMKLKVLFIKMPGLGCAMTRTDIPTPTLFVCAKPF